MDEHPIAGPQAAHHDQPRIRGRVVDGKRGPLLERERVRQRQRLIGRNRDELGMAAEPRSGHHPVADREARDAVADRIDLSGDLVADDARRRRRVRIDARAGHQVGEVDARRPDGDPHLARPGLRVRPLFDLQDLGPAVLRDDDCFHSITLSPSWF
jgi:hypothetical protein